jgi:hypothetical protein
VGTLDTFCVRPFARPRVNKLCRWHAKENQRGGVRPNFERCGYNWQTDRIAQTVVKLMIEPILDPLFHKDSYGYRPGKSAKQAIAVVRQRCWQYDWIVEFDIKAAFDQIDHALLTKAVRRHIKDGWAKGSPHACAEIQKSPWKQGTRSSTLEL